MDYLDEKSELKTFYNHFPNIENFKKQIEEKNSNFNDKREILASELEKQYLNFDVSDATSNNIELLKDSKNWQGNAIKRQ